MAVQEEADVLSRDTYYLLPTAYYLLLTMQEEADVLSRDTYYLLLTTYYLLLTTYYAGGGRRPQPRVAPARRRRWYGEPRLLGR